ncbi:MAG TPA: ABC transporter ATP-binding protein [Planctomycetota bacterium]|nr:ABC transporter ATP-binding protein [Planctomycetota bacterium]
MSEAIVQLKGVEKAFGRQRVLAGVDLEVLAKETLVIIGKSGSGKSVTLRHMVGLTRPDAGHVLVFGKDIAALRPKETAALRLRMGYLFQAGALLNWMTIGENVELPLLEHRRELGREERQNVVEEKLKLVEMAEARDKFPDQISGGMKKRAALARAIVLEPEIIFYDEPTSGLDPVISRTIDELILHTAKTLHPTQVVVTHAMDSAFRIADRIAMLYEGRIIACGDVEAIQNSEDPVVRQFITGSIEGPIKETGQS